MHAYLIYVESYNICLIVTGSLHLCNISRVHPDKLLPIRLAERLPSQGNCPASPQGMLHAPFYAFMAPLLLHLPFCLVIISSLHLFFVVHSVHTYWNIDYICSALGIQWWHNTRRLYLQRTPSGPVSQGVICKTNCVSPTWELWWPTLGSDIWIGRLHLGWLLYILICELGDSMRMGPCVRATSHS